MIDRFIISYFVIGLWQGIIMPSIYLLIPLSLILFVVAIWAIWYAVKSNQFEDLDNAPEQIILDDRQERRKTLTKTPNNHN